MYPTGIHMTTQAFVIGGAPICKIFRHVSSPHVALAKVLILVLLSKYAPPAHAETLTGRVGITDGDTITVLIAHQTIKDRLACIDAPESGQVWGLRSTQALSELCGGQEARLEARRKKDRDKRTIGTDFCGGMNANREQVRHGMAWVFDRYARQDSLYRSTRGQARSARTVERSAAGGAVRVAGAVADRKAPRVVQVGGPISGRPPPGLST